MITIKFKLALVLCIISAVYGYMMPNIDEVPNKPVKGNNEHDHDNHNDDHDHDDQDNNINEVSHAIERRSNEDSSSEESGNDKVKKNKGNKKGNRKPKGEFNLKIKGDHSSSGEHSSEEHGHKHHHHHYHFGEIQTSFAFDVPDSANTVLTQFKQVFQTFPSFLRMLRKNNQITDKSSVSTIAKNFRALVRIFNGVTFNTPAELKAGFDSADNYIQTIISTANGLKSSLDASGRSSLETVVKGLNDLNQSIENVNLNVTGGPVIVSVRNQILIHTNFGFPLTQSIRTTFDDLKDGLQLFHTCLQRMKMSGTANAQDVQRFSTAFDDTLNLLQGVTFSSLEEFNSAVKKMKGNFKTMISLGEKMGGNDAGDIEKFKDRLNNIGNSLQGGGERDGSPFKFDLGFQASPQIKMTVDLIGVYLDKISSGLKFMLSQSDIKDKTKADDIEKQIQSVTNLFSGIRFETEEQLNKALSSAVSHLNDASSGIKNIIKSASGATKANLEGILGYFSNLGEEFGDLKIPGISTGGFSGSSPRIRIGFDASPQVSAGISTINSFLNQMSSSLKMLLKIPALKTKTELQLIHKGIKKVMALIGGMTFNTMEELKSAFSMANKEINNMADEIRTLTTSPDINFIQKNLLQTLQAVVKDLGKSFGNVISLGSGGINFGGGEHTGRTTSRPSGRFTGFFRPTFGWNGGIGVTTQSSGKSNGDVSSGIQLGFQASPKVSMATDLIDSMMNQISHTLKDLLKRTNIPEEAKRKIADTKKEIDQIIESIQSGKFDSESDLKNTLTGIVPKINRIINQVDKKLTSGDIDETNKVMLQSFLSMLLNLSNPFGVIGINNLKTNVHNCPCA